MGLRREREVLTVALEAGRHVVIEGPPGTGKSTLLRDIARQAGQAVVFAEGNAELTPARLIGQYDPAQVLNEGYVPASFQRDGKHFALPPQPDDRRRAAQRHRLQAGLRRCHAGSRRGCSCHPAGPGTPG